MTSSPPPPPPRFKPPTFSPPARPGLEGPPPPAPPSDAPPPKKGRSALFWVALGCTGCVVLPVLFAVLFAGALGGGIFYFTREPVQMVRTQLEEMRRGDLDAAYARLSDGYRAELSKSAFADFVKNHATLHDHAESTFWNRSRINDEMRLQGTLTARSGTKEQVSYLLVRERGEWKVARIRFEP